MEEKKSKKSLKILLIMLVLTLTMGIALNKNKKPEEESTDLPILDEKNPKWKKDSDNDGLNDAEEEILGTDINKKDTDEDGLEDKYELEIGLEPTKKDTDENGVFDGDEDLDKDKLTNTQELKFNTNPLFDDTDGEGLSDFDEIKKYKSDPNQVDTDKDGLEDAKEIELGTDVNNKDSNNNGIIDGEEEYTINIEKSEAYKDDIGEISLSGEIKGEYVDKIYVTDMEDSHDFISSDMPGYVSKPFRIDIYEEDAVQDIEMDYSINTQNISSDQMNNEFAIYGYNEESNELDIVSESVLLNSRGNNIDIKLNVQLGTTKYKDYILLNKTEWDKAWQDEILEPGVKGSTLDIALVIDSSESMTWNDPNNLRKQESVEFVNNLEGDNRAVIVDFDDGAKTVQELTKDKSLLKDAINQIDAAGGTNVSSGIREALKALQGIEERGERINKYIMLLTDGEDPVGIHDEGVKEAKRKGIKIFTIGLGDDIDVESLQAIANETEGKFLYAKTADELDKLFEELTEGTIDILTDTDNDGIPNYFEQNLRLENGIFINLNEKDFDEDGLLGFEDEDSDGDGIIDGEEITGKENPTVEDFNNMFIKEKNAFKYVSRPDKKEDNAIVTNKTLHKSAKLSYLQLEKEYEGQKVSAIPGDIGEPKYNINIDRNDIDYWDIVRVNNGNTTLEEQGGFGALAIRKGTNMIIAFTGTDFVVDVSDIIADVGITIGANHQVPLANTFINNTLKNNQDIENIYITGHSLGGYLAQHGLYNLLNNKINYADNLVNIKGVTFSSPQLFSPKHLDGISGPPILESHPAWNAIKKDKYYDNIDNYFVKQDPVAFVGTLNLGTTHKGFEDVIPEDDSTLFNFDKHSLYNFYKYDEFQ